MSNENTKHFSRRTFFEATAMGTAGLIIEGCSTAEETQGETQRETQALEGRPSTTVTQFPTTETFSRDDFPLAEGGEIAFVKHKIPHSRISAHYTTDVLVLGAGIAGACTAASAAEMGLAVTVLEKGNTFTGRGTQIAGINDVIHRRFNVTVDKEQAIQRLLMGGNWKVNGALIQKWADKCDEAINWLYNLLNGAAGDASCSFGPVQCAHTTILPCAVVFSKMMSGVVEALLNYVSGKGCRVLYDTPACQLVTDVSGAVTGAIAKNQHGDYVEYTARKGVVLCTGSYEFNQKRMQKYMRPRDLTITKYLGVKTDTGDGHEMGVAVGGIEDEYPHVAMVDPSVTSILQLVRINSSGERFAGFLPPNLLANCIQNQLGATAWVLIDGDGEQTIRTLWGSDTSWSPGGMITAKQAFDSFVSDAVSGDTVGDLADKIGVPRSVLEGTINRWNVLCEKQADDDFGTPTSMLVPIKTSPFYAKKETTVALVTVSGLRITAKAEVISGTTRQPIKGLYAVGNVSGGFYANNYPHDVAGHSHSRCVTFGYLVGRQLAAE